MVGRALDDEGNLRYYVTPLFRSTRPLRDCETFSFFVDAANTSPDTRPNEADFRLNGCVDDETTERFRAVEMAWNATGIELFSQPSGSATNERQSLGFYHQIAKHRYYRPFKNDIPTPVYTNFQLSTKKDEIPAGTMMMGLDQQMGRITIEPSSEPAREPATDSTVDAGPADDVETLLPRPLHPHVAWLTADGVEHLGWIDMESFVRGTWTEQKAYNPEFRFRAAVESIDGFTKVNAIEVTDRATGERRQLLFAGWKNQRNPDDVVRVSDPDQSGKFNLTSWWYQPEQGGDIGAWTFLYDPVTRMYSDVPQV